MQKVTSKDGTPIAFEKQGAGPALLLVDGALNYCSGGSNAELARLLAPYFMVYRYDRRGRGQSGDTQPYAVEREVEDIDTLILEGGSSAYLYGHSSGAALALEAAIQLGERVQKLALYEAPYNSADGDLQEWKTYLQQLRDCLSTQRRGDAIALFMGFVGMPANQIDGMRQAPFWPGLEVLAPTLEYDHAVLREGRFVPIQRAADLRVPTLVMNGGAGAPFMAETARALAKAIPYAQQRILEGQTHDVAPEALAAVLIDFFGG